MKVSRTGRTRERINAVIVRIIPSRFAVCLAFLCVFTSLSSFGQANDTCAGAIALTPGIVYSMDTTGATSTGDPKPSCETNFGNGVWFTFTPSTSGFIIISTCESDFNTLLQVYTGSCGALTPVSGGCNDDDGFACSGDSSLARARFAGTAGTTYRILVGGYAGEVGNLSVMATVSSPPPNDTCAGAIALPPGVVHMMSTAGATSAGDSTPSCQTDFANGVWFTFTPATNGNVIITTCGSDFDTALQVYTGGCGSLTPVNGGCNDDDGPACGSDSSLASVSFPGTAATTYRILVGGYAGGFGNLSITAKVAPPPTNDSCTGAISMTAGVVYTMDTAGATSGSDPKANCQTNFGSGVWYAFTPSSNGTVIISSCGSDFNTVLQVYTGSCGSLTPVNDGCNDDSLACGGEGTSASVSFVGTSGTTYRILAGGYAGAFGNLHIVATVIPSLTNDTCAGALAMTAGTTYTLNTAAATSTDDPAPDCEADLQKGVWFTFTPASSGTITISTCGSDFDTVLAVYTRTCGSLTAFAGSCNDDNGPACSTGQASVRFNGLAGTTYRILAGGFGGGFGNLNIVATFTPTNDTCAGAIAMTSGTTYQLNTAGATSGTDPILACQNSAGNGVWFTFVPSISGTVTVSTCGSDFDTALQIYTGSCGSLTSVSGGCNDQGGPSCPGSSASVAFLGTTGTVYRILASGSGGASGNLNIVATECQPPASDLCGGGVAMVAGTTYTVKTTCATSASDPASNCGTISKGVWFTFTPGTNGIVTFNTCGSDFDTALAVYTGNCGSLTPVIGACNDDNGPSCTSSNASVSFSASAGITYRVLAGGFNGANGNLSMIATLVVCPFPVIQNTNTFFSFEPGGVRVFYVASVTGPSPLIYQWTFFDSSSNTLFSINPGSSIVSRLFGPFDIIPTSYNLTVRNNCGSSSASDSPVPPCGPICLSTETNGTLIGTSGGGAGPTNLTNSCGFLLGTNARWFNITVPNVAGFVNISTEGSDYDTMIAVFRGTKPDQNSLRAVACNDDISLTNRQSRLIFGVLPGTNYWLAVNTTNGGTLKLTYGYVDLTNEPPVLTLPSTQTINELTPLSVSATATDPDLPANPLTFELVSGPAALTVSAAGGIAWMPSEADGPGNYPVTVRVFDNNPTATNAQSLSATGTFNIVVNEVNGPPAFTGPGNQTVLEETLLSVIATATDSDLPPNPLAFTLLSGPAGLTVTTNGLISWTPSELEGSNAYTVSIRVSDYNTNAINTQQLSATNTFTITVLESNRPPVLTLPSNQTLIEETPLSVTAIATDPDIPANALTFSLVSGPAGLNVAPDGAITWTPAAAHGPGNYTVIVRVTDSNPTAVNAQQLSVTNSFMINVIELATNRPPVLTLPTTQTVPELVPLNLTATATDPDVPTNTLTFGLVSGPSGLSVAASGSIAWTPNENQGPSTNTVVVRVEDNGSPSLSHTQSFQIIVEEVNSAPSLAAIPNRAVHAGTLISFDAVANDADVPTNTFTFSLVDPPVGAVINATNGGFTWTPGDAQLGTTNIEVHVSDSGSPSLNATQNFIIRVEPRPAMEIPVYSNGVVELRWSAITNTAYRLQFTPDLTLTNWSSVAGDVTAMATSAMKLDTNAVLSSNSFYRVIVLP